VRKAKMGEPQEMVIENIYFKGEQGIWNTIGENNLQTRRTIIVQRYSLSWSVV
jgi:hypothetical protein